MPQRSDIHVALGLAVREARQRQELSQEQLALESGLDRTYVGGIERGERNPTLESLLRIAQPLETRPSRLLSRAEELAAGH